MGLQEFHEGRLWQLEEDGLLLIGVTQSALDLAGTVTDLDLADPGDEFEAGDWIGELRGKNTVVDIVAPCALRISERNEELREQPSILEDDPTGDAWIFRVESLE